MKSSLMSTKSSQVTFIYIGLFTIQIVSGKQENNTKNVVVFF